MQSKVRGSIARELATSLGRATWLGAALATPVAVAEVVLYVLRWGGGPLWRVLDELPRHLPAVLVSFVAMVVVHEVLHGVGWVAWGRLSPRAIRFGFATRTLSPYAHCSEPLSIGAHRLGIALPNLLLGLLPALLAIVWGSGWLLLFGAVATISAGGDLVVLWLTRRVPAGQLVLDHDSLPGVYLVETVQGEPHAEVST